MTFIKFASHSVVTVCVRLQKHKVPQCSFEEINFALGAVNEMSGVKYSCCCFIEFLAGEGRGDQDSK